MKASLLDLRDLPVGQLSTLLAEEAREWQREFLWDFGPSATLVERFAQLRSLHGYALMIQGYCAGYGYYVAEESKGLIGDFYVRPAHRTEENENVLLDAILTALWRSPGVQRVEAQPLTIGNPLERILPYQRWVQRFPRMLMEASLPLLAPVRDFDNIEPWHHRDRDASAALIERSYRGHVDAEINDQYRTTSGADSFLANIIQYPGCGEFQSAASFASRGRWNNLTGICLASKVGPSQGHITQVCVDPSVRGEGLGGALLAASCAALGEAGCNGVSLTVTEANRSAVTLYERLGFRVRNRFAAYVWRRDQTC